MEKNIGSLDEFLSFLENPVYRIAEELRKEGYEIAGHMGVKVPKEKQPPHNMVGILKDKKPLEKNICGFKYNKKQRADLLAEVWEDNTEKDKKLIAHIYGYENFREASRLIKRLSSPYRVKIVKLVYKDPREENYLSDIA
jgi:hypothetical protein